MYDDELRAIEARMWEKEDMTLAELSAWEVIAIVSSILEIQRAIRDIKNPEYY